MTAAAVRENATQSGVSQHIRNLEASLGVGLFNRDKGRMVPTPAAESYYLRCLETLRAHEAATRAARTFVGGLQGEVVVGLMPTVTRRLLAPAMLRFMQANPNVVVRATEGYSGSLIRAVQAGELDFAVAPAFTAMTGLKSRLFLRTFEILVSRPQGRFETLTPVSLRSAGALKLVLPARGNARRATVESYCISHGVVVERLIELDAMLATLDLVGRSDWCTILPSVLIDPDADMPNHAANPLVQPTLPVELSVIEPARKTLSPAAEAFLAVLQAEAVRLGSRWLEIVGTHAREVIA